MTVRSTGDALGRPSPDTYVVALVWSSAPAPRNTAQGLPLHLAQTTTKELALCSIVGEGKRPLVGERGLSVACAPAEQVGADRVIEVVALEVQRVHQAEGGVRTLHLGEGHRAIQLYHRARGHDHELVVELEDLPPVC